MKTNEISFTAIDWSSVPKEEHTGDKGTSFWQTIQLPGLRIRIVEYSKGYIADHWCRKGHIVHCLEGEFTSENQNDKNVVMKEGMTYVVSDELSSHRSVSEKAVKLLIIDGDFLKSV